MVSKQVYINKQQHKKRIYTHEHYGGGDFQRLERGGLCLDMYGHITGSPPLLSGMTFTDRSSLTRACASVLHSPLANYAYRRAHYIYTQTDRSSVIRACASVLHLPLAYYVYRRAHITLAHIHQHLLYGNNLHQQRLLNTCVSMNALHPIFHFFYTHMQVYKKTHMLTRTFWE